MNIIKIDDLNLLKGIEILKGNFEIPESIKLYIEKGEKLEIKWEGDNVYITYPLKASYDAFTDMSYFHNDFDNYNDYSFYVARYFGKRYFFADVLIGLMDEELKVKPMADYYKGLRERFSKHLTKDSKWNGMYIYIYKLIDIVAKKCCVLENLKKAYDEKNAAFLKECADKLLPELVKDFEEIADIHEKQWMRTYKPFGYEVLDIRYGGVKKRLETAARKISDYLEGKIPNIEELEEERLLNRCEWDQGRFHSIVTGCNKI